MKVKRRALNSQAHVTLKDIAFVSEAHGLHAGSVTCERQGTNSQRSKNSILQIWYSSTSCSSNLTLLLQKFTYCDSKSVLDSSTSPRSAESSLASLPGLSVDILRMEEDSVLGWPDCPLHVVTSPVHTLVTKSATANAGTKTALKSAGRS
jgi:hypothetical protein